MNPFAPAPTIASSDRVYHFFVDNEGKETGEYEEIRLAADGSADLSSMRDQRQAETWKGMGIRDEFGLAQIYPTEGRRFLKRLLKMNNQLWRFRSKI